MINNKKYQFEKFHWISSIEKPNKILPREKWPDSWKRIYFKGYPRFEKYPLEKTINFKNVNIFDVILKRKSSRDSQKLPLSRKKLSLLLLGGAITRIEGDIFYDSYRAYPSAGARYPLEIYLIIQRVSGFKSGIYHYHVRTHSLEYLWNISKRDLLKCFPGQKFVSESRTVIIITAIMSRLTGKYSERSYRYALIESGHLAQNFYLIAQAIEVGVCALGGFNDKKIIEILDLNLNKDEIPLYCIAIP